jgi:hypothetical protein
VGESVRVSEFVCVLREGEERSAHRTRSRKSRTQAAPRWSLPPTLPLTGTLANLRCPEISRQAVATTGCSAAPSCFRSSASADHCVCATTPAQRTYPVPTADELLAALRARQAAARSLNLETRTTSWLGGERVRGTVQMLVERAGNSALRGRGVVAGHGGRAGGSRRQPSSSSTTRRRSFARARPPRAMWLH